jgi:hypothetical protein
VPGGDRSVEPPADTAAVAPRGFRRRSNIVLVVVAVAAAVLVAVAGMSLIRQGALGTASTSSSGDADAAARSSTTVRPRSPVDDEVPANAVLDWVTALGTGDVDAAWAALGPASIAHFGSRAAFEAEAGALAEGLGAWARSTPERVLVTPLPSGGEAVVVVVTLVGTVERDGRSQERADAVPVRIVDGAATIEPFAFAGEVTMLAPEPATAAGELPVVRAGDELVVVVPRGVDAPMLRLDGGDAVVCGDDVGTQLTELSDAPGQQCSYRPSGGIERGTRVLTIAFASPDGSGVSARSVLFEAA